LKGELFINYSPLSGKNAKTGEEAGKEAGVAFRFCGTIRNPRGGLQRRVQAAVDRRSGIRQLIKHSSAMGGARTGAYQTATAEHFQFPSHWEKSRDRRFLHQFQSPEAPDAGRSMAGHTKTQIVTTRS
jgi:hypothetical protein